MNRRDFIGGTLRATAVGTILGALPSGAAEPSAATNALPIPKITRKVKLGTVGCGKRGFWIAKLFRDHGGFEFHAAGDYFPEVAKAKGQELGVPAERCFSGLSSCQKVIESGVEAIVLELPPYFFPDYAKAAVAAGLHVYMAKPVAVDVPGALIILECGRQATMKQRSFLVDYQMPTDPVLIEIRNRILAGALGKLAWVETIGFQNHLPDPPKTATIESRLQNLVWCNDVALGGDTILSYDIHAVDAALWVLGQRPVSATGASRICRHNPHGDSRDVCSLVYEYADGLVHNHSAQGVHNSADTVLTARIFGQDAYAELCYFGKSILRGCEKPMAGKAENLYPNGAKRNIAAFYDNITQSQFANDTVTRAVDSCLTCILGREAAARHTKLTMAELIKENKKLEVDLTRLKA